MRNGIARKRVVTLVTMDPPNLMPMFNAYCLAATLANKAFPTMTLPSTGKQSWRKYLRHAGLLLDKGENHYTIVSTAKGGVIVHYVDGKLQLMNSGVVIKSPANKLGSTQYSGNHQVKYKPDNKLMVTTTIAAMPKATPTSFQFLVIRVFGMTLFRFTKIREWFKQGLVKFLITKNKMWPVTNERTITLGEDIKFEDETDMPRGYSKVNNAQNFVPIHMASQGYWQIQDEDKIL
jgi:hypothetical protein